MSRWLAPWVATLRIARRQAGRAKGRTALSAVMVGMPIAAITALLVLAASMVPTESTHVRQTLGTTAEAVVTQGGCGTLVQRPNSFERSCGMSSQIAGQQQWEEELDVIEPLTRDEALALVSQTVPGARLVERATAEVRIEVAGRRPMDAMLEVFDTTSEIAQTVPVIEGRLPLGADEIALPRGLAARLGVTIGSTVTVDTTPGDAPTHHTLSVTAVVSNASNAVVASGAVEPPALTTYSWFVLDEPLDWARTVQLNDAGLLVTSRHLLKHPPTTPTPFERYESSWGGTSDVAQLTALGLLAAVALLEIVLLVGPAFAVGARRQARSLALVAASGGTRKDLRRIVLASGLVIGAGSSVLAVGLGIAVAAAVALWPHLDPADALPNLVVPPWVALLAVAGTSIAVLAAWIPARHAARIDTVAALAGRRSEATPRPTLGIIGLAVAALGVPLATWGGYRGNSAAAGTGGALVVLGLVAASGLLISLFGSFARRAGVTQRIALRDLARQRGRTAPAAASILGALAAAVGMSIFMTAETQANASGWRPELSENTVKVSLARSPYAEAGAPTAEQAAAVEEAIVQIDPGARVARLAIALPAALPDRSTQWSLSTQTDESQVCPWYSVPDASEELQAQYADDPRCIQDDWAPGYWQHSSVAPWLEGWSSLLVDDGTAFTLVGTPKAKAAAEALAAGTAVSDWSTAVWGDGTIRLESWTPSGADESVALGSVPGVLAQGEGSLPGGTVLPPQLLDGLGLRAVPHAVIAAPSSPWGQEQEDALYRAIQPLGPELRLNIDNKPEPESSLLTLAIVGAAGVLALGATWVASGLAAVESRADLATLAAVGAAPAVRRRVAGLQAAFLALVGVLPGILGGLALGWAFVASSAALGTDHPNPHWQMIVPWPVLGAALVGLPLLAGLVTAAVTPSKLPLGRRNAE